MEIRELEELANEFLIDGCGIKERDIEKARLYFCIAWGFNRQIEKVDYMVLCEKLLKSTGLDEAEINAYKIVGYRTSAFAIDLENAVLKILAGKETK